MIRCNMITEIAQMIESVSATLGKPLKYGEHFQIKDLGCPHKWPKKLESGYAKVYIFMLGNEFIKIGKANNGSGARATSQHYRFNAPSTVAKSLCADKTMPVYGKDQETIKLWMLENLRRIDVEIKTESNTWATSLIEGILHYKFTPRYEGHGQ